MRLITWVCDDRGMVRRGLVGVALLAAVTATLSGVARGAGDWQPIELPGDLRPASLTVAGGELWVGGRSAGERPGMAHGSGTTWAEVPVVAESTYARQADLVHVIVDGGHGPKAIGIATGGQHLLPRWTVWAWNGSALIEQDQTFETFGGLSAGGLTDMAATPGGPRILGAWSPQNRYIGTALWSLHASTWRRDEITALASTKMLQQLPAAMDTMGERMVIVGTTSRFEPGGNPMSQQTMWLDVGGTWAPLWPTAPTATSNGVLSDVACEPGACWAVGGATTAPAARWQLTVYRVTADGGAVASSSEPVPDTEFNVADPAPVVAIGGGRVAVLDNHDGALWLRHLDGQWVRGNRPPGSALDAGLIGGTLYVILERDGVRTLWSTPI